jgi:hypothetical protein
MGSKATKRPKLHERKKPDGSVSVEKDELVAIYLILR